MIGYIYGDIIDITERYVIVDTKNIGYIVYATENTLKKLSGEKHAAFFTYLSVKEDALDLYGFETQEEKRLFELLISVSGIGPRGALAVLDIASLSTLAHAIRSGDSSYLTRVSGIGKKTAEKIVVELKDKPELLTFIAAGESSVREDTDVRDALIALGYREQAIRDVLKDLDHEAGSTNERIKQAIRLLGK